MRKLYIKVILEHVSGTPKANLEHAKVEMERVLAFRGSVTSVKAKGQRITLEIAINPKWEADNKVNYLREWIPAKVKRVFEVISVSE